MSDDTSNPAGGPTDDSPTPDGTPGEVPPGADPRPIEPSDADPFQGPDWSSRTRKRSRTSPEQVRHRVHGRSRRTRRILLGTGLLALAIVVSLAWLAYTAFKARTELEAVRSEVRTLRVQIAAGDLGSARATAASLKTHAAKAHDLTTGPIWAAASALPYVGDPLDTARVLSASVNTVAADALPPLIDASNTLVAKSLRKADGSIDVAAIQRLAPLLGHAITALQDSVDNISNSPGSTWLGSVDAARHDVLGLLPPLISTLRNADVAARTMPSMLGANGPKSYFVSFLNEAELRGLGGLPGAFAILKADHGKITFTRFESDSALSDEESGLDFGFNYDSVYSGIPGSTASYLQSSASPHFPYPAQIWTAMWKHKTGQQLDGAIALDPTALSYLLAVTGPAKLPGGSTVSADNVVRLTQQTAYDRFGAGDNDARKRYLLAIARAASEQLLDSSVDPTSLVRAAAQAVTQHRLVIWSSDPATERALATTPIAGTVPATPRPFIGLAMDNRGGNKLDYYLHASLDYQPLTCGTSREVRVTLTLRNEAPAHLAPYVIGLGGTPRFPKPRVNRMFVQLLTTEGGTATSVTLNGKPLLVAQGYEQTRPVYGFTTELVPGRTQTVVYTLRERDLGGSLLTRLQPMINPVVFTAHDAKCGS